MNVLITFFGDKDTQFFKIPKFIFRNMYGIPKFISRNLYGIPKF